jgi:threonine dehydrogenase-like Zn-dependent dehydrogenase
VKAVRVVDGAAQLVDADEPRGDGVILDVASAGICGSDLHLISLGMLSPDVTIGHEFAGTTPDGRRMAVEPVSPCGVCAYCLEGDSQVCTDALPSLLGIAVSGGMAERVLVRPEMLVPLAEVVDLRDACLVEPLAIAVHGFGLIDLRRDQTVAVVGGGTIGQCAAAVARNRGCEVAMVARHDAQRAAADRLGAVEAGEGPYDVVVDCAGTTSGLAAAAGLARPSGTILILASYWSTVEFPGMHVTLNEIRMVPSSMYGRSATGRDTDAAAAILAATPELPTAIVTHRFPLDGVDEAFAAAADRSSGSIKVAFDATL